MSALFDRARSGEKEARDRLFALCLSAFQTWAHGRLPRAARDLSETDDLVQNTLLRALKHLDGFEQRRDGAFVTYLWRILMNQVRDEIRRAGSRPRRLALEENLPGKAPSPLESAIREERLEAYRAALARLPEKARRAVVLRLEGGLSYREVAESVGSPSPNAARMTIARALVQMAEDMDGSV